MSGLPSASIPEEIVPGSVEAAYEVSHVAQRRAKVTDEVAARLRRDAAIEGWTGEGADAYTARMTAIAQRWLEIGQGAAMIVEPMRTYALALRRAQGLAAAAIEAWSYAATLPEDATAADGTFTSYAHGWPAFIPDPRHQGPAPATREEARARAEAMLADARADVAAAGEVAAQAVRAAIEKVRARGDVWASVGAGLGVTTVTSERVLDVLQSLDARALTALLRARPDLIERLKQTASEDVAPWWRRLSSEQQDVLVAEAPGVIGNLGGVTYAARDRANRIVLAQALAEARNSPWDQSEQVRALEALEVASRGRTLASLVLDRPPLAQVAVGDLDRASYVSVIVPGMNTSVANDIQAYVAAAVDMRSEQSQVGRVPASEIAVLASLGYHPPTNDAPLEVLTDERAVTGARALAHDLDAFHAVRAGEGAPQVTAIGHSYGTDVVALALESAEVDHAVLLGSAGISKEVVDSSGVQVPMGEVYASQSTRDGWAPIGQHFSGRTDPTDPSFHSHVFSSEAVTLDGDEYVRVGSHGPFGPSGDSLSYLDPNTSAQHYAAMIAMGQGSDVPIWGEPAERDARKLEESDQERYR